MFRKLFGPRKVKRDTIVPYNDQNIQGWGQQYKENEVTISTNEKNISTLLQEIEGIDKELRPLNADLNHIDTKIQLRKDHLNREREHHYQEHHDPNSLVDNVKDIFSEMGTDSELSKHEKDRDGVNSKINHLMRQRSSKQDQLTKLNKQNRELKEKQAFINRELPQAKEFMRQLDQEPQVLCETFAKTILDDIAEYEVEHPANQKFEVRICLHNIKAKVNHILNGDRKQEGVADWPTKYAQLCGLLWDMLDQVDGIDSTLSKAIMSILEKSHIAENCGLPGDSYERQSTLGEFQHFKKRNTNIYPTWEKDEKEKFEKAEDSDYFAAHQALRETLDDKELKQNHPDLYKQGKQVLDGMHESVRAKGCWSKRGDVKLNTIILTQTKEKIINTAKGHIDKGVSRRFDKLTDNVQGHPSLSKKVISGLLGLTSAALFAVSVTVCVATFGASTPLSALGIAISTTLFAKALALTAAVVTATVTVASVGVFADGAIRHGMSKKLDNVANAGNQLEVEEFDMRPALVP